MRVLYISYDGILDALGQSQIIPYLLNLNKKGVDYTLLSYEKKDKLEDHETVNKVQDLLRRHNIRWKYLKYHKAFSAISTTYDITRGILEATKIVMKENIEIIHARSFVGAVPALFASWIFKRKFIFDMRGFWPEERVDGELWKKDGFLFKIAKFFEHAFISKADHIVVLTLVAREILKERFVKLTEECIKIIPTCVDLALFSRSKSSNNGALRLLERKRLIFVYSGSIGTWYCMNEMIDFFKIAKEKINNAFFLVLTPLPDAQINTTMKQKGLADDDFVVKCLNYNEMPSWLSISDISLFFIKPVFSKKSSCPTKFAESLACGLPVVTNNGIGDCDDIITRTGSGVLIEGFNPESYIKGVNRIKSLLSNERKSRELCRQTAEDLFSLSKACDSYLEVYQKVLIR